MDASAQKLDGLEALRGVAALVVLLHHGFGWIALPQNFNTLLLGGVFREGNLGVNIFFVLSGFVITWSNPKDGRSARDILIYVLRRITRIYPMYWVACLAVLPVYAKFAAGNTGAVSAERIVHDVLLFPYVNTPMLPGAWTLVFEMLFYMLFVPMLISRRAGLILWAAVTAAIGVVGVLNITPANAWVARLTSPYVLEFLAGMLVCLIIRRHPVSPRAAAGLVWAGTLLMLAFVAGEFLVADDWAPANLHYAFCGALMVAGLVSLPAPAGGQHSRIFRVLQFLGRYSFSIYLFHIPVQQIMVRMSVRILGSEPGLPIVILVLLATLAGSLIAGMLAGRFLELPMLEWCKRRIARLKVRPAAAAGSQA